MVKTILFISLFCWRDTTNKDTFIFWNVENFYDWICDSTVVDEFYYNGQMRWNYGRFVKKRDRLAKTILDFSYPDYPTFIGLAEIENRLVLNQLIYKTPLIKGEYGVIHRDSPDVRGIDVALLYIIALFNPIKSAFYPLISKEGDTLRTREILYCKGVLRGKDTLHILINHWPSKYSGKKISDISRSIAAKKLHNICDSILSVDSYSNIIVCGDFNETTHSNLYDSLLKVLVRVELVSQLGGTIKYRGVWQEIDHFFVSQNIYCLQSNPYLCSTSVYSHEVDYLLVRDIKYTYYKPYRTYIGPRYIGGFSDHLPIKIILISNN